MFQRFTEKSRRALFFARYFATEMRAVVMQPEHLLEGVLEASPTSVSDAAVTVEVIRERLAMTQPESDERPTLHEIIFSPALKRVLQEAAGAADALGHQPIRPEHLLLAILADEQSAAARALRFAGVEREALEVRAGRSEEQLPEPPPGASGTPGAPAGGHAIATIPIVHVLPIAVPAARVFDAVSLPDGLDRWWTLRSSAGARAAGAEYHLDFGPGHDWRAVVSAFEPPRHFELHMTRAGDDWLGTKVGFQLTATRDSKTRLHFHHSGWRAMGEHYWTTAYCWAMYLRLLRRYLEYGETVPYDARLDA